MLVVWKSFGKDVGGVVSGANIWDNNILCANAIAVERKYALGSETVLDNQNKCSYLIKISG